ASGGAQRQPNFRQSCVPQMIKQNSKTDEKSEIAHAVGDKRLDRRVARRFFLIPKADQQIAAQADQLPEDEKLQRRSSNDQAEHRKAEQAQIGEKTREALILAHVAD